MLVFYRGELVEASQVQDRPGSFFYQIGREFVLPDEVTLPSEDVLSGRVPPVPALSDVADALPDNPELAIGGEASEDIPDPRNKPLAAKTKKHRKPVATAIGEIDEFGDLDED